MTSRKTTRAAAVALTAAATFLVPTLLLPSAAQAGPSTDLAADPVVIGHRGASGYRPEHTLASYELAIRQGADYIEPDLVSTEDGVLVARHENEISGTTDVADHPEFADRRTTKVIDGRPVTGWFTEDFTYQELRTLRAVERLPDVRPDNTAYDGEYRIPTLDEVLKLARREGVGVYPETKHPSYFDSIGLSLEEPLVAALAKRKLDDADDEVIIQSFEVSNLRELDTMVDVDLAQLVDGSGGPADLPGTTYASMVTAAGLRAIATYADGVGAAKNWVLPRDASGATGAPSAVVDDAHAAGLVVHVWTLRRENQFMASNFRVGTDPNAPGDLYAESRAFLDAGVDGLFSDNPDVAARALADWLAEQG
ncbi:glycerophosphodiester phosphodiesterase [Nocardioides sp. Soil805]|uniref:glycerophosphodiester phosphodiesterase n=1 Tax=Nocardioides sp. Soil805 TaxID=1736416 RepID=UPI0007026859|nr:glycerophosphodiester phosphodiesterase [Nocardioides sp. Soil805]KRF35346.1 glycerophosphodiester phosphodiesterase [Nocardioides sp. Soil805]